MPLIPASVGTARKHVWGRSNHKSTQLSSTLSNYAASNYAA